MHSRIVMPPHIGATKILQQTLEWLKEDKATQADRFSVAIMRRPARVFGSCRVGDRCGGGAVIRTTAPRKPSERLVGRVGIYCYRRTPAAAGACSQRPRSGTLH